MNVFLHAIRACWNYFHITISRRERTSREHACHLSRMLYGVLIKCLLLKYGIFRPNVRFRTFGFVFYPPYCKLILVMRINRFIYDFHCPNCVWKYIHIWFSLVLERFWVVIIEICHYYFFNHFRGYAGDLVFMCVK